MALGTVTKVTVVLVFGLTSELDEVFTRGMDGP